MNSLACFVVCCLLGLAVAAPIPPTRPQISDVFFAKVQVDLKVGNDYWHGGGLYAFDVPSGRSNTDLRLEGEKGTLSIHVLDRYDLKTIYDIQEGGVCKKTPTTGSLPSPWAWVSNAVFTGTSTFQGRTLDVWEYSGANETLKVSVLQSDTTIPVYYSSTTLNANGSIAEVLSLVASEFNTSTPESWVFYVPEICNSPKSIITASPSGVIYFANSQWDCSTPTCASRVPAGSSQPGYECAEFVARSLAYGGYIPGLTSSDPQASYGNYKGHNLLLTTGLATALADLGFKKLANSGSSVNEAVAIFGDAGVGYFSHTCIGVGPSTVDCHNNARKGVSAAGEMYLGIDAVYGP